LKMVRLATLSGTPPVAVDLRILDLGIRTGTPIADSGLAADGSASTEDNIGWVVAVAVVAVLIAGTILGVVFLYMRQVRRARKVFAGSGHPLPQAKPPPVAERPVSFRCSGCRKTLKGKPEMAGKKIRCPECGTMMLVPSAGD
jgi:DNA-directed RNA polymerase subunit RPC12/RpoP